MVIALEPALTPCLRDLRIVLQAGEDAKKLARSLDPKVCSSKRGPYDLTNWLDLVAKNLSPNAPVRLVADGTTRNWLEVDCVGESEPVRFAPYIGTIDKHGNYKIHAKGKETYALDGLMASLFGLLEESKDVPETVYPYVLRIIRKVNGNEQFELHFLLGELPKRNQRMRSYVRHFGDPFIVTMEDGPMELPAAFTSPFDPQGVS
ncbi:MAG TPA: hypothetical protein VG944_15220 [Fimbriimonas sp.]|nr:hypothetical protein [Fimbriimonas sp.]